MKISSIAPTKAAHWPQSIGGVTPNNKAVLTPVNSWSQLGSVPNLTMSRTEWSADKHFAVLLQGDMQWVTQLNARWITDNFCGTVFHYTATCSTREVTTFYSQNWTWMQLKRLSPKISTRRDNISVHDSFSNQLTSSRYTWFPVSYLFYFLLPRLRSSLAIHYLCFSLVCPRTGWKNFLTLLNPTGYVTHQQFNIQQFYVLSTPYLCFVFIWGQTATCATYSINWLFL